MRFIDTLSLSTRMFKTRPLRTFLTILGVSVGIGAVLFLVSLGYGMQNVILSQITTADALLSLDVTSSAADIISLTQDDLDEISRIPEVEKVSPVVSFPAQLSNNEFTGDGLVYAVDTNFFRLNGIKTEIGNIFDSGEEYSAVISSAGIKLFGLEPKEIIGQYISLVLFIPNINDQGQKEEKTVKRNDKYKVIGVIEDENANYVYIPNQTISDLNIEKFDSAKIKVKSNDVMGKVRDEIIEKGFLVSSLSDTIDQANKVFRVIQIILALFGLVALTVSAIGMFNTMTIALLERINEIGIMRAIGITKRDIMQLFLFESVLMGFLGGLGGILIGYLGGEIANFGINILAKNFGGQELDLFYSPLWFIFFVMIFSTVIGFITGLYPSRKASKLNPLDALRYK